MNENKEKVIEQEDEIVAEEEDTLSPAPEIVKDDSISAEQILEKINNECDYVTILEWHGLTLKIKKHLELVEMLFMVNEVVKSCFGSDGEQYNPASKDFMERFMTIDLYSNINMPGDTYKAYDIVYCDELYCEFLKNIDDVEYFSIRDAIDELIQYRLKRNVNAMCDEVLHLAQTVNKFVDRYMGDSTNFMDDLDADTLNKFADALSSGEFDTEKFVQAIISNSGKKDENSGDGNLVDFSEATKPISSSGDE